MVPRSMGEGGPDTRVHLAGCKILEAETGTNTKPLQKYTGTAHHTCFRRGISGIRFFSIVCVTMQKRNLSRIVGIP